VWSLRRWLRAEDIVVVLNLPGAADQSAVDALRKEATVVSPAAPQGYAANLNFGVRTLGDRHELLVLANDDVVFENGSLRRLVDCMSESPRTAVAGARLVYPDGREAASFSRFPTTSDLIEAAVPLPGPLWRRRNVRPRAWEMEQGERGFPVGAALLVRRDAYADVGGFDEDFFLNWEEADFCFRLLEREWGVISCRDATVTHLQGSSIARDVNFTSFYTSLRLYFRKRLGPVRWALLEVFLVALFAGGLVYDALGSLGRPGTAQRRLEAARQRWRTRVFLRHPPRNG
jgi:N-acetylglucosaminyl-diphospho-decaprenol L-rhamnosyltransferase